MALFDFKKKYAMILIVAIGVTSCGICAPNDSMSIIEPKTRIEYIAPFLRYTYFLMRSILETVSLRKTSTPKPLPTMISVGDHISIGISIALPYPGNPIDAILFHI